MGKKRVKNPVIITTVVEEAQHEALRTIAYKERLPMAELVRKALDALIKEQSQKSPPSGQSNPRDRRPETKSATWPAQPNTTTSGLLQQSGSATLVVP